MDYRDLPYDAEIEYLGLDRNQRYSIITNISQARGVGFGCELSHFVATLPTAGSGYPYLIGFNRGNPDRGQLYIKGTNSGGSYATGAINLDWQSSYFRLDIVISGNNKQKLEIKSYSSSKMRVYIDGTSKGEYNKFVPSSAGVLSLLSASQIYEGRIYHLFAYDENNDFLLDAIPVRVGNVGYLFDKVSGQLFGNSATGSFVLGPDVAPGRYANEIAFLESTGSQYIDTGIKPTNNTRFVITMDLPKMNINDLVAWFFGSRNGANNAECGLMYSRPSNQRAWDWKYGNSHTTLNNEPSSGVTVFDNYTTSGANELKISNLTLSATANTFTGSYNFYLFTYNVAGTPALTNCLVGQKLISAKLYEGTTLVRDFIPVEYNNIGYMYDKVSGQFFANQGTGKFVLGHRAPRFDGKACARSYTRRQLMAEKNKRFSLLYHWEASDGIVNNQWIDRRKGYAFTKYGSPIVTTVSGYEVMRTNYDSYFKANLNSPALNMGSEWMIAIEFIITAFPTDTYTYLLDFGSLGNATHAFGFSLGTNKRLSMNVKLNGNTNTFRPPTTPIEFVEYKMSTIIFGAEPYDSTHNNIYTIVGGVKTSASSYPTIANCRFNGNFSSANGFFGRGWDNNTYYQSKSYKYIKSIKIYKDNKKR